MTMLDLDKPLDEQITLLRKEAACDVPIDVREYYDGDQPMMATITERENLGDRANKPIIENMLKRCTDTLAGRLLFKEFVVKDDTDLSVTNALKAFAIKNKYAQHVIANTVRVLVDGNNAMSLAWKKDDRRGGRVVVHQESWWDGKEGMFVSVDDEGLSEWAVKEWTTSDKLKRRTIYLEDRIIRQVQRSVGVGTQTAESNQQWVSFDGSDITKPNWIKRDGSPLGVPVVHFGNTLNSGSQYGTSHIVSLLGLQDALNGALFDCVMAGAMSASGIYSATGVSQTEADSLRAGPAQLWATANDKAAFSVLGGQKLEGVEGNYNLHRKAIAGQFPVPEHIVTGGDWPSGLALQKVESPMIGMVKLIGDMQASGHVTIAHRSTEIMNAFGAANLDENKMIQIEYDPPEQLDEGTIAEIDQARVEVFRSLMSLPPTLMVKTGLVDEKEANAIAAEIESQFSLIGDAASDFDDESEAA